MKKDKITIDISSINSYVKHEAWFELCDLKNGDVHGKKIVNSYGRVREIWEDGTYKDLHDGKQI